jgi:hypothetical protein
VFITPRRLLLIIGLALLTASPSRGEVGLLVLEPVDALGFFTRVGHTGTYFSNICPDGSLVQMRLCHAAAMCFAAPNSRQRRTPPRALQIT